MIRLHFTNGNRCPKIRFSIYYLIKLRFWYWVTVMQCYPSPVETDLGGQPCACPVIVSFLSGFLGKSCPVSVCCPDSGCLGSVSCPDSVRIIQKKCCPVSVCPDFSCLDSVRCPDFVRIVEKSCPLSVRPAGQGRDRAVRTFTVLVRRRLLPRYEK